VNNEKANGAETMHPKSTVYDFLVFKSVWTVNQFVEVVTGPKPVNEEQGIKHQWTCKREIMRQALMDAVKTRNLVPLNKEWINGHLKELQSGTFGNGFEIEVYGYAQLKRDDVIRWMEEKQILEDLKQKGYQIPDEAIKLIKKVKRIDQIKTPETEASKSARTDKLFKSIFPAPEGTRWQKVLFTIEGGGSLKIKVKGKERTLNLKEFKKYFPQEQQRELLLRIIREPGGVFDKEICKKVKGKAFQNSKHIISDLRKSLKDLFEITGDPIKWNPEKKSYEAQFSVHSEWDTPANSNLD